MKLETVKLTKVYISDKKKDGTELKTKKGDKYWKVAIQTVQTGKDYHSCLVFRQDDKEMGLVEGQEVQLIFEEKDGYKNFKMPSRADLLEFRVSKLEEAVFPDTAAKVDKPASEPDISDDDLPF